MAEILVVVPDYLHQVARNERQREEDRHLEPAAVDTALVRARSRKRQAGSRPLRRGRE